MVNILLVSPRKGEHIAAAEYQDVLKATGLTPDQVTHRMLDDATKTVGDTAGFDGIIVGGSPLLVTSPEYDDWQLQVHKELEALLANPLPVFFLCYGNTFVASITGGSVNREWAEDSGPTVVRLTEAGLNDPITSGLPAEFLAVTGHTENAASVGTGVELLATGPTCPIQIVRANASTWACQFHAEMDADALQTRMDFYYDYGYFSPADYDTIVATTHKYTYDGAHQVLRNFVAYCE
ncbi:glutamine amidotransferase [Corynebacterium sp. 153RC1]|uniref:glutamine amidotransferase n=1 Tax=Corynebacterium TaxID=1716 RepID=UPI00211C6A22|nr:MULTISPECIES: glutamine amidotransferase [unclassified Corynebacterium]MCQ9369746.1 glutamine amidotransferase [Corynebacterium sp. 35RC1]MCQ9342840.1 glutamine amidotransferase [Corynebacterium sp. 76QC2CO]MCQ9352405.1 glutamine amidotransferase [Corynebacterium sp. 209RC1]MCQ9354423.1 glutamine amidotransferase [Corynebacterium sp. 1222RC1]MCQ9356688.1 glutamine amidotransferase [Corynebacterium sp. 122RC1]